jgi:hypothetical protein
MRIRFFTVYTYTYILSFAVFWTGPFSIWAFIDGLLCTTFLLHNWPSFVMPISSPVDHPINAELGSLKCASQFTSTVLLLLLTSLSDGDATMEPEAEAGVSI